MQVKPVASPHQVASTGINPQAQADAKARAIAKLTSQQPVPLQNPSNISVEELGAVQAPKAKVQAQEQTEQPEAQAKSAEASEPVQDDKQLASRFAQLAKREKAMRAQAQIQKAALDKREADIKAREDAASKPQSPAFDPKEYISRNKLKENAFAILNEEGITYDQLTQQAIQSQQAKNPLYDAKIEKLEAEIQRLSQASEKSNKTYEEAQQSQYKAAVEQIRKDVAALVKTDPNYEVVRATGSINDVVELIEETYKETGEIMSIEAATEEVENYLIDEASKLSNIDKIQKKLNAAASARKASAVEEAAAQKQQEPKQPQQIKTLTNTMGSTGQLSARARAVAAFEGRLKS